MNKYKILFEKFKKDFEDEEKINYLHTILVLQTIEEIIGSIEDEDIKNKFFRLIEETGHLLRGEKDE